MAYLFDLLQICKSIDSYKFAKDEEGNPLISECQKHNFAFYYTTAESVDLFDQLWYNTNGLQDKFHAYWSKVSQRFAHNDYVLGYDPINEPFPSPFYMNPTYLAVPGKFDRTFLQPLEKQCFETYQKWDDSKIMFWEPV